MSEHIEIVPEKIHLRSIKLLGGNITANEDSSMEKIFGFNVQYGIKDELLFEENTFRFVFSVNLEALNKNEAHMGIRAQYSIEFIFYIENLEHYVSSIDKKKNTIVFHSILPNTLLSIVYSTSRGIILSRTQGTVMEGVILPVIDTKALLTSLELQKMQQVSST